MGYFYSCMAENSASTKGAMRWPESVKKRIEETPCIVSVRAKSLWTVPVRSFAVLLDFVLTMSITLPRAEQVASTACGKLMGTLSMETLCRLFSGDRPGQCLRFVKSAVATPSERLGPIWFAFWRFTPLLYIGPFGRRRAGLGIGHWFGDHIIRQGVRANY